MPYTGNIDTQIEQIELWLKAAKESRSMQTTENDIAYFDGKVDALYQVLRNLKGIKKLQTKKIPSL